MILSVTGPLLTPRDNLLTAGADFCTSLGVLLEGECLDYVSAVADLLIGHVLHGTGTPNALLTAYLSTSCEAGREWQTVLSEDIQRQVTPPVLIAPFESQIISGIIDSIDLDSVVGAEGNFSVEIILASQDVLTATVLGPMFRPCSNAIDLPSL